ncbi:SDR family oxidoreductase [Kribbella sandramycini]|uniref:NAD(P)-dependent dehydrogenase (Short-subunit alcohol dehydrogenase family) n=1 Tax=Kribbella sandramycini TaxID=60450 RepID=A0A7Y4NXN3_9ACTN|nr:SDR family NAD(P)-dependent oxidoreductase [Kribbella sandramycini]MBB6568499.1 NAD(P)-dependent dehydrogenase (short-subunit alcohol dehydrogenase family) [Kribbella sandramycini]NOL38913.1 SDR family oxidoreductase [Kribbella sandramycini]
MTAVVTGAGRGIGRAIAVRLAADGAEVVLGGRDVAALNETAALIGDRAHVVPVDIGVEESVASFGERTRALIGTPDVVVCNSGIGGPSGPLWTLDLADWQQTLDVNVTGTFLTLRAFLPGMVERGSGGVVLIGSMTGKRPLAGRTPYAASKLALVGLARTLAVECGPHGVRVNVVSPGFVAGPRLDWVIDAQAELSGRDAGAVRAELLAGVPLERFVAPEEVADAVGYLASSAAVTGADLNVSGGLVMY